MWEETFLQCARFIVFIFIVLQSSLSTLALNYEDYRLQFDGQRPVVDIPLIRQMATDDFVGRQVVVRAEDQSSWYISLIDITWQYPGRNLRACLSDRVTTRPVAEFLVAQSQGYEILLEVPDPASLFRGVRTFAIFFVTNFPMLDVPIVSSPVRFWNQVFRWHGAVEPPENASSIVPGRSAAAASTVGASVSCAIQ